MHRLPTAAAAALLLACGAAQAAVPAHYVVFQLDEQDQAEPLFYAQVQLADAGARAETPAGSLRGTEALGWQPLLRGVPGTLRQIHLPSHLHSEAADATGELHRHEARVPQRVFVLRIPLAQADSVELVSATRVQHIDLHALAGRAGRLPLASVPPAQMTAPLRGQENGGSPANRLDILLLGDGYRASEQTLFAGHAAALHAAMFNITPYKEYASFVNWRPGFVASVQSGADHPPFQSGCNTTSCCADPAAQSDPLAGTFVNTALDARFCTSQIHRTLYASAGKVYAAAAGYPDWDKILVTVNDPVYGGAGGSFAVQSAHALAPSIVIHEFGHSFTGLADEYDTPYPGFPACSDTDATPDCEANVTNQTSAAQVKWRSWFTPGIAIPTPAGTAGTGLFEGARYLSSGMYRPTDNRCLMKALGSNFCAVCTQEYILKLYRGGFGTPAAGIALIEPGSEHPPTASPVAYAQGTRRRFGAGLLQPSVGTLGLQWYLDGEPIPAANGASHEFHQAAATPATRTLELRVTDTTALVQAGMAGNLLRHSRSWQIEIGNDRLFADGME